MTEYNFEKDLNKIYNKAVINCTSNEHIDLIRSYEHLVIVIDSWERWRETALQISKNYGSADADAERLAKEYTETLKEMVGVFWEEPSEKSPALIMHKQRVEGR